MMGLEKNINLELTPTSKQRLEQKKNPLDSTQDSNSGLATSSTQSPTSQKDEIAYEINLPEEVNVNAQRVNPLAGGYSLQEQIPVQRQNELVQDVKYDAQAQTELSNRLSKINQAYGSNEDKGVQKARNSAIKEEPQLVQGLDDSERKGNRATYLYNKVLEGVGNVASGLGDIGVIAGSLMTNQGNLDAANRNILDYRNNAAPSIREYLKEAIGADVDKGLEAKYNNETITSALGGLASSAPAIAATIASGGAGTAAMFAQSYDTALESINESEAGRNLDEATKTFFAGGVGLVTSALEKYGLDKIFKGETGVIANMIARNALKKASQETGGKVTGDILTSFLDKEVVNLTNKYIKGGVKALDGALVEYGTEGLQEAAQATAELLTNAATGKPVFDTSETSTWDGFLRRVNKAGVAGAIGGGLLGSVAALGGVKADDLNKTTTQLNEVNTALQNEELSESARQVLIDQKVKLQKAYDKATEKIDNAYDKLDTKQKDRVNKLVEDKVKVEEAIADPSIPESVKENLKEQSKEIDEKIGEIKPVETDTIKSWKSVIEKSINEETEFILEGTSKTKVGRFLDKILNTAPDDSRLRDLKERRGLIDKDPINFFENQKQYLNEQIKENPDEADKYRKWINDADYAIDEIKKIQSEAKPIEVESVLEETNTNQDGKASEKSDERGRPSETGQVNSENRQAGGERRSATVENEQVTNSGVEQSAPVSEKPNNNVNDIKQPNTTGETKPVEEVVQPTRNDGRADATQNKATSKEKIAEIEVKRQSIKDRISEKLKAQRSNLNTGIDPTLLKDFAELGATYIEEGIVNAKDFIKRFREDYKDLGFDDKDVTDAEIKDIFDKTRIEADINTVGLTKEDVRNQRSELGQEQFEYEVRSNAERINEARRLIDEGYNIKSLVKKLNADTNFFPTATEVEIVKQYYASLTERINQNPTPELLRERNDLLKTIDVLKVEQGRSIQAWDGLTALEDNLSNFLTDESQFVDLNQAQIKDLTEKYNKAQEALRKLQAKEQEALEKQRNKKAQSAVEEAKKTGNKKLVKEAYQNERREALNAAREALKKVRGNFNAVVLPYQAELIAIAPHVRTIMKSYVSEGVYELKEIVKKIHDDFKDVVPDLTENDVRDIIAGEHRNPKQTKNAKLEAIRDLERQAKLEKKIEELENGILETKNPVHKRAKNEQIAELEQQIKEIKKRHPELTMPSRLEGRKTWLKNQIENLKEDIRKGNYEPVEPPTPILLDDEALRLKDEYIKFKEETRERRQNQERQNLGKIDKAINVLQELAATKRLVQTSIDLSIPLRQGVSVMMNPMTFGIGSKAYKEMVKGTVSEKQYERMMFDIERQPEYLRSKDDGIVYQEVGALNNEKRDEYHRDHFLYKAPVLGKLLRGSERAAAAWTNYARYELYLRGVKLLEAQGKTRANSKQAYEDMAARVMVDTGRGKIPFVKDKNAGETDGRIKRLLGNTLYGARLASAIFRKLDPTYYFNPKIDRTVRVQALKDMAGYVTGLVALGAAATAYGYTVSFDPDDSDFLKLRKGKEVIDITGGMSTYIRTFLRLVSAAYKQADPDVSHEDANKYANFAFKSLGTFWRNKLAPNTSYAMNAITGENTVGEKFNPWEIVEIYPMYTDDIIKAFKDGSPMDLATIIPLSMSGLGYQTYEKDTRKAQLNMYLDKEKDSKVISFLKSKQLSLESSVNQEVFNVDKGVKEKMTKEQADKYEKLWSEYIIDELKDGKASELAKYDPKNESDVKKLKKEINTIKFEANRYAKSQIIGVADGVNTIKDDDKTYELNPEQVQQRVKLIKEFMKDDGETLKESYQEQFIDEGVSKVQAKRKALVKALNKANAYSRSVMLSEDKDANDGKVSFKEKEDK